MQNIISYLEAIAKDPLQNGDKRNAIVRDTVARATLAKIVLAKLRSLDTTEVQPINLPRGVAGVSFIDDCGNQHTIGLEDDGLTIQLDCMQIRRDDREAIDTLCNILQAFKE